jgi:hypothetical protein
MTNLKVPAVIVESAFIDNSNDNIYADTLEERENIGKHIAYGILNYLNIDINNETISEDNNTERKYEKEDSRISIIDKIKNLISNKQSNSKDKINYIRNLILK